MSRALRSNPTEQHSSVDFENRSDVAISVFRLDASGARDLYRKLNPRYAYQEHTQAGEVWVMADNSGKCVALFRALPSAGHARIGDRSIISRLGIPP